MNQNIIWFKDCSYANKHLVGGKCSSLGELYHLSKQLKFCIADGFAITTSLYNDFIQYNNLNDIINSTLGNIDFNNLEIESNKLKEIIISSKLSDEHSATIIQSYKELCNLYNTENIEIAVRSSALAEDLPNASFAGQQDTYLNVKGEQELLLAVKKCFASLFNGRAISYRKQHNIGIDDVKISVGIQKMVRSDIGSAGVGFSIDPETGYNKAIVINSAFGLGELVVSGGVTPDEFILDKRVLYNIINNENNSGNNSETNSENNSGNNSETNSENDIETNSETISETNHVFDPIITTKMGDKNSKIVYANIEENNGGTIEIDTSLLEKSSMSLTNNQAINLGKYILKLEEKYSALFEKSIGIDVEWAIDGLDNQIYIIQTRPETIHSNTTDLLEISKYILSKNKEHKLLLSGISVGDKISSGNVKYIKSIHDISAFCKGDILVTEMTTPDWEPIMKISSGIITNKGGRTCHAAIVARELNLNAIVGTGNATDILKDIESVTISCADGETGKIYKDMLEYTIEKISVSKNIQLPVKLMLNVGNPENSFHSSMIPNSGVGLTRIEFIISNYIKIHPLALYDYPNIPIPDKFISDESKSTTINSCNINKQIRKIIKHPNNGKDFFIKHLAKGMSKIASAFYPNDVIVRLSDFKSNEYRNLIGGDLYEPNEENPMIGWRGASRYYSKEYERAFEMECQAIKYARENMQMTNIIVMIPFCRTTTECKLVLEIMSKYGLTRGENGLQVYLMCEIPSNVIEAQEFSELIDGVSIGGNDLLQLTIGVDRDSDKITYLSDDTNISYRRMIHMAIQIYKSNGVKIGFCGQQPSDSIEFCNFLINEGIDSISVTPDSALKTIKNLGV